MKHTIFTCFLILLGFAANAQHGKPDTICSLSEGDFKILIVFDSILQENQIKTWYKGVADSTITALHPRNIKCRDLKIFDKHRMVFIYSIGDDDVLIVRDWTGKTRKGVYCRFMGSTPYATPNRPFKIEALYYNKFMLYHVDKKVLLEYDFDKRLETRTEIKG
jgi:hypothetical protein